MTSTPWPNPFIEQRADPFIQYHNGVYYFIASVPEYDRLEIRQARTIEGLRKAKATVVWRKPDTGPMGELIWAPELHRIDNKWYIYFAAAHTRALDAQGMFRHRMYVLECTDADPLTGTWQEKGQFVTPLDSFALDATTFSHQGKQWYLWAQKDPDIAGNTNLYLAEMATPWSLKGKPVMLSKPEYDWECRGFMVNEGPAVIRHGERLFITYSASATDENYCLGLLWIDQAADPLNPDNWHKSARPVFTTSYPNKQYGPGHNSFTRTPEGKDVLVYHARNYTEIEGDPLYDPGRHTRLKYLEWDTDGMPLFGEPPADNP
ncbi:family 43 glycosylhydrolase [Shimwellia blattae]|uniref:Putative alpha-N-arabinofuranosidase II n=1 Tax=Shimwellia blattae (strain ATCC 29907 / DSM 4481 / JCM 1650 / NBRC 105725 / CDC 9005-74) TaxID=630626 RepID=I2BCQ5_SHIBC|nr:family 43 glycosylhydrolase [Shimwellia blattae]AFJ48309.1 putative alpha-N-arabinofuranosidase II [Shimwellia blattae DSM 4481 = NBRC 105725]GAB81003.1 putative glycosyl hydrolase [Shimwellia blattae DSM 4481 = NBRC 105725]VDY65804.1 Alpha-N-arabinofuranosidase 2 precursor [Shimwellia blattae]VEC25832.1 Alpha-N-arabinofuranosidase 2 precursor [Shimwellia blattae]